MFSCSSFFSPSWNDCPKLSDHENIWDESGLLLRAWTQQAHWVPVYPVAFAISQVSVSTDHISQSPPVHGSSLFVWVSQILNFYLFMAVLGLRFCARAFSSCGERGPLFIAVRGPLIIAASLVAEHRLQTRRLSSCGSRA